MALSPRDRRGHLAFMCHCVNAPGLLPGQGLRGVQARESGLLDIVSGLKSSKSANHCGPKVRKGLAAG